MTSETTNARPWWRIPLWGGAAALLTLPAIAMRMGAEGVIWTASDFVFMGLMLAAACAGFELLARLSSSGLYRAGAALAVAGCFLTVWINLAVGAIGSEDDPANLLFALVLATVIGGAILSRGEPRSLARALAAAAALQVLIGLTALAAGWGDYSRAYPRDIVVLTAIFTAIWLAAAGFVAGARRQG